MVEDGGAVESVLDQAKMEPKLATKVTPVVAVLKVGWNVVCSQLLNQGSLAKLLAIYWRLFICTLFILTLHVNIESKEDKHLAHDKRKTLTKGETKFDNRGLHKIELMAYINNY